MTAADLAQGFALGFLNPLTVPAHLLSILALGVFAGSNRALTAPLAVFAIALGAGLIALTASVGATPARDVLLGVCALNGLGAALAITVPRTLIAVLAAVTGITLGLDSPPETVSIAVGNAMLLGTWISACLLAAAVASCASRLGSHPWQRVAMRVLGSWGAASAIMALALRLFR
jgi:hydrogenase/urease accessory protein HupE